jgi:hypothetical protein
LVEIEELLVEKGLNFGMDLAKYRLEEDNIWYFVIRMDVRIERISQICTDFFDFFA